MAWCHQATSHYLSQCWPRSMLPYGITSPQWLNSLWRSDAIWWHRSVSTLAQVMACCLTAPSHNQNQCSLQNGPAIFLWQQIHSRYLGHQSLKSAWKLLIKMLFESPTPRVQWVNSLWPSDAIWRHGSGSALTQVMVCCLTAPSHYLNQYWHIISKVQWHLSEGNFIINTSAMNHLN